MTTINWGIIEANILDYLYKREWNSSSFDSLNHNLPFSDKLLREGIDRLTKKGYVAQDIQPQLSHDMDSWKLTREGKKLISECILKAYQTDIIIEGKK